VTWLVLLSLAVQMNVIRHMIPFREGSEGICGWEEWAFPLFPLLGFGNGGPAPETLP
jgi:hypothetical protein